MSSLPMPNPCDNSKYHIHKHLIFQQFGFRTQPITFNHESFLSLKRGRTNFEICYRKTGIKPKTKRKKEKPSNKIETLFQFCAQCSNWKLGRIPYSFQTLISTTASISHL